MSALAAPRADETSAPLDPSAPQTALPFEHLFTHTVAAKAGCPRLYFEARYLETAGFTPGIGMEVAISPGHLVIRTAAGRVTRRSVSRRTRKTRRGESIIPVIDLKAEDIRGAFGVAESVQVLVRADEIIITATKLAARRATRCRNGREGALFAGGGLLSEAARSAGFTPTFAVELEPKYAEIYQRNHPGARMFNCSVAEVPFLKLPPVELLTIGLPCEPYAAARSTDRGTGATRSFALPPEAHPAASLLFAIPLVLEAINPATVIVEESDRFEGTAAWHLLCDWLRILGYHVESRVLNARDHGSLAARKRTVVVAISEPGPVAWPVPVAPTQTAGDILNAPEDPENEWFDFTRGEKTYVRDHWQRSADRGHGRIAQMVHSGTREIKTITKRYLSYRADNPVVVEETHLPLLERPASGRGPLRPGQATRFRLFTLRELKRIHGLRDDYDLGDSKTTAGEVIGQGVDVTLFSALLRSVTRPTSDTCTVTTTAATTAPVTTSRPPHRAPSRGPSRPPRFERQPTRSTAPLQISLL